MNRIFPTTKLSRLTLGTAQLGLSYGVANAGQPSETEAFAILDIAAKGSIHTLDTARAYGTSEEVLGRWQKLRNVPSFVVTKLNPLTSVSEAEKQSAARRSLSESATALGRVPIELVLAHREDDLLIPGVRNVLDDAVRDGNILAYGASVTTVDGAMRLMDAVQLAAIQVPASLADRRFAAVIARAKNEGVKVFARSVFLQGALLMRPLDLPDHLKSLGPALTVLAEVSSATNRPVAELCLLAVRDRSGIDSLVVGVDNAHQLKTHIQAIEAAPLHQDVIRTLKDAFAHLPDDVLDPSRWPK